MQEVISIASRDKVDIKEALLLTFKQQQKIAEDISMVLRLIDAEDGGDRETSFVARYSEKRPLRTRDHSQQYEDFMDISMDVGQKALSHYRKNIKNASIANAIPKSPQERLQDYTTRMQTNILVMHDLLYVTLHGFNLNEVHQTYIYCVEKARRLQCPQVLTSTSILDYTQIFDDFSRAMKTLPHSDLRNVIEAKSPHEIEEHIRMMLYAFLQKGYKNKISTPDKKIILAQIDDELNTGGVYDMYKLATKYKHLYTSVSGLEKAIDEYKDDITQHTIDTIMTEVSTPRYASKNGLLGHIFFYLVYYFNPVGQEGYHNTIASFFANKKKVLMRKLHEEKLHEEKLRGHDKKADATSVSTPLEDSNPSMNEPISQPAPLDKTIDKISLQDSDIIISLISQLDLEDASLEDEIYTYIERMVSHSKEIRLGSWMKSKHIYVDSEDVWHEFLSFITEVPQIQALWYDDGVVPLPPTSTKWHTKNKKKYVANISHDTNDTKIESSESYDNMSVLQLIHGLDISIPDMKRFEERLALLPKDCLSPLKRMLFIAKQHPIFIKDRKKYIILKFRRKYRLVIDKKSRSLKDHGIYIIGLDYDEKMWAEMSQG